MRKRFKSWKLISANVKMQDNKHWINKNTYKRLKTILNSSRKVYILYFRLCNKKAKKKKSNKKRKRIQKSKIIINMSMIKTL